MLGQVFEVIGAAVDLGTAGTLKALMLASAIRPKQTSDVVADRPDHLQIGDVPLTGKVAVLVVHECCRTYKGRQVAVDETSVRLHRKQQTPQNKTKHHSRPAEPGSVPFLDGKNIMHAIHEPEQILALF